jgi:hypothetical protein
MKKINQISRLFLFTLGGIILGFAYYYFIGCRSGSCPITSSPYISSIYGGIIGFVFGYNGKIKIKKKNDISRPDNTDG